MKDHLTYLFGAGASRNVLPVDNDLTTQLKDLLIKSQSFLEASSKKGYLSNFVRAHDWLLEEFQGEKSLDVIAKKYSNDGTKLFHIKTLLWLFFSARAGKDELDSRYISLLTRLTGDRNIKSPVPDNVSFLTWNYDLQMEEAYSRQKGVNFSKTPEHIYALPGIKFVRQDYRTNRSYPEFYQLIHLNGSAGYFYPLRNETYFWCNTSLDTQEGIDELATFYGQQLCTNRDIKEGIKDSLSFSWEDIPLVEEIKAAALREAERITHLVIVGYSLPDLNRPFDITFFGAMKNLKEIIIQDPFQGERILDKLRSISPSIMDKVKVELEVNPSSFRIPNSYTFGE